MSTRNEDKSPSKNSEYVLT